MLKSVKARSYSRGRSEFFSMTCDAIRATGVRTHIEVDAERQAHWYVMVSHSGRAGMGINDVSLGREN